MPIIKSAKKRVRVAQKAAIRNAKTKRSLKTAVKSFQKAVDAGDAKAADKAFRESQSGLDIAMKKNLIHQNKVARLKRQLAAKAKAVAGVAKAKDTPTKAAKTANKKPAASSAAKQPAAKKPAAKKTGDKK